MRPRTGVDGLTARGLERYLATKDGIQRLVDSERPRPSLFAVGWRRFWQTFRLPWQAVLGFAVANLVCRLSFDLLWWLVVR